MLYLEFFPPETINHDLDLAMVKFKPWSNTLSIKLSDYINLMFNSSDAYLIKLNIMINPKLQLMLSYEYSLLVWQWHPYVYGYTIDFITIIRFLKPEKYNLKEYFLLGVFTTIPGPIDTYFYLGFGYPAQSTGLIINF